MQDYRKLLVWRKSHDHVLNVHDVTKRFPRTGYAPLKSQLARAVESIPNNIVEGSGASTRKEFARYLEVSIKSACEVQYQLELSRDYGVLGSDEWEKLAKATIEIRKMLCGLRAKVLGADRDGEA